MHNLDIRLAIEEEELLFKDVAKHMGIHKSSFSRIMRNPLSAKNKLRIMKAIDELKGGAKDDADNS